MFVEVEYLINNSKALKFIVNTNQIVGIHVVDRTMILTQGKQFALTEASFNYLCKELGVLPLTNQ